ncbi:hypothetical protein ZEAMMB73_Zm00001d040972 [Zea mays]|uniref:ArsA/GET3 Anion-transporting ATPase-like domain-containing protein n=1 Tax=Zea mays TaxID=4577 RepID=A0A1D6MTM4_MAIZE|nr:hypothetical protein ZEAMMB73_Zm00001d040972 [Zea mays]
MGLGTHSDIMSMITEMLDGMPPGLEEALVLSKVIKSIDVQEADILRRIVLDAPSTGHTLKLLSASDWIEMFLTLSIKGINVASSMPSFNMYLEDVQFIGSHPYSSYPMQSPNGTVQTPTAMIIETNSKKNAPSIDSKAHVLL